MRYLIILLFISNNLFAHCPESKPKKKIAPPILSRPLCKTKTIEPHKNRLRLLGGLGPKTGTVSRHGNYVSLDENKGLVLGLGYDRLITNRFSIGAAALSNETFLLNLGLDF
jgi:hypothetical protein